MKKINFQRKNSDEAKGKENDSVVDSVYKKIEDENPSFRKSWKAADIC